MGSQLSGVLDADTHFVVLALDGATGGADSTLDDLFDEPNDNRFSNVKAV